MMIHNFKLNIYIIKQTIIKNIVRIVINFNFGNIQIFLDNFLIIMDASIRNYNNNLMIIHNFKLNTYKLNKLR